MKQEPISTVRELGMVKVAPCSAKGSLLNQFVLAYFSKFYHPTHYGFYFRPSWR